MENLPENPIEAGNWIQLQDRAVFRLTGPDRVRYLNGQVSNDVSLDLETNAIAACVCTLKGKVEALVWISSDGESLIIDGELGQREALFARLDRYLIADDCELHDITDEISLIHHFDETAPGINSTRTLTPGKDLWISNADKNAFPENERLGTAAFELAQLLTKIPKAGFEITANEFPAELGLDTRAVNFHKGCYLGQEVISRIESVGRVKRKLLLATSPETIGHGTKVKALAGESEATASTTRNSTALPNRKHLTLALFKNTQSNQGIDEPIPIQSVE